MYFRFYRPKRAYLDKCVKDPVREEPPTGDMVNGPKHWFSIKESSFIILSDHCEGIFSRFLKTLTTDDKYSLISIDNWMQTIQIHFSQKQNIFSEFSAAFFESALNFQYFQKKITFITYVFIKLPTTKDVLR